jgi:hypothetical protein
MTGGDREWYGALAECLGQMRNIQLQISKEANELLQAKYQNYKTFFNELCTESCCSQIKSSINFKINERTAFFPLRLKFGLEWLTIH